MEARLWKEPNVPYHSSSATVFVETVKILGKKEYTVYVCVCMCVPTCVFIKLEWIISRKIIK